MSENTYSPLNESPGLVKTIAVMTLINGIINIFWGLIAAVSVAASVILICLVPLAILPTILGVFEIIYAAKLLTDPPRPVQPSTTIAILEILCILTFNVFSMIVGILSLVFYNDPQVKEYFARLNGLPVPATPEHPAPPAPPTAPSPAPVTDPDPPAETAPKAPETPKPKQPRKRKVAAEKTNEAKKSDKKEADESEKPKRTRKSGSSSS
jgi:type IV secretory pathway VirB10-like protein